MTNLSVEKYKFYAGNICDGLFGVYTCCREILGILNKISDVQLDEEVVKHFFHGKEPDSYGWCPDAKYQSLAILKGIIICFVCTGQDDKKQPIVTIKFYGKNTLSVNQKCVYMVYDEIKYTFKTLNVTDKETQTEKMTTFNHDDTMKDLLQEFIKDDLKYEGDINFGDYDTIDVNKASTLTDELNNSDHLSDIIDAENNTNLSQEQKPTSTYEHLPILQNRTINSSPSTLNENNDYAQTKLPIVETNQTLTCYENNSKPITMGKLVQVINSVGKSDSGYVQLRINTGVSIDEVSHPTDSSKEIKIITNSILSNTPIKRKGPVNDIPMSSNNHILSPIPISNETDVLKKRTKTMEDATDQMSTFYKNNSETMTMENLIQAVGVRGESDMHDIQMNQQQIGDRPIPLNDEHQEEKVEDEKEAVNKLVDDIQDNNEINYSCESSTTKTSF